MKTSLSLLAAAIAAFIAASIFAQQPAQPAASAPAAPAPAAPAGQPAAGGRQGAAPAAAAVDVPWNDSIPPGTDEHAARALKESTRHGEWVDIKVKDQVMKSFVVYPERAVKTGVVLVIYDIFGMRDLAQALGDQLAQDGYIAIVPDFAWGKGPDGKGTAGLGRGGSSLITGLTDVTDRLDAAMAYGKSLPASNGKTGVIGFCWGGTQSFAYAAAQPNLNAAVVFYGSAPQTSTTSEDAAVEKALANVKAPVIGFYGGADMRINATLPQTEKIMKSLGKSFEPHIYEGAGHGFMFGQGGSAANLKAAQQSWPLVLAFYKKHLN